MTTNRSSQRRAKLPWLRTAASALLLLTVLVASGCGSSHRSDTRRATVPTRTETVETTPTGAKYSYLAFVSARSGDVLRVSDLEVGAAASDGNDGWYVSGGFGLARMLPNGKLDPSWGTPDSRKIKTCGPLIKSGSRLYLARWRDTPAATAGTAPQNSTTNNESGACVLGALDAATGKPIWTGKQPFSTNHVFELVASSTRLYAAGMFSSVGKAERQGLATFDAATGELLDWRAPSLRIDSAGESKPFVTALALTGSRLYVGGSFNSIDGKRRTGLAALDPSTGALLPWKPPRITTYAGIPFQIAAAGDQFIVVGDDGFAAVSLSSGRELAWRSVFSGTATRLTLDGSILYLGGNIEHGFGTVGNKDSDARYNLAALDLESRRFTSWAPRIDFEFVDVGAIVPSGEQVLVVGAYTNYLG